MSSGCESKPSEPGCLATHVATRSEGVLTERGPAIVLSVLAHLNHPSSLSATTYMMVHMPMDTNKSMDTKSSNGLI
jgi:hypothetical protein